MVDTDFRTYYDIAGLASPNTAENRLAAAWFFKPEREGWTQLDRLGVPRRRWRDIRTSSDWEAFYCSVWASTMKALADDTGLSVSRIAKVLGDRSPFGVRHIW